LRRGEAGCLLYDAHESRDAPGVIVMVEAWSDQAALDAHAEAVAFTKLAARFDELLAQPPAIERLRRIG
jgi:quinol monooxygenase YgiN